MGKRTPAMDDAQLGFSFDAPQPLASEGALASLERLIASGVARILKDDSRSRFEVAGAVSALLDDDVSKYMLDAYSSESREAHRISAGRFLALVAATGRYDVLDAVCRQVGAGILVGEEIFLAEIGHLESQRRQLDARLRTLKATATPLTRGGARR